MSLCPLIYEWGSMKNWKELGLTQSGASLHCCKYGCPILHWASVYTPAQWKGWTHSYLVRTAQGCVFPQCLNRSSVNICRLNDKPHPPTVAVQWGVLGRGACRARGAQGKWLPEGVGACTGDHESQLLLPALTSTSWMPVVYLTLHSTFCKGFLLHWILTVSFW